MLRDRFGEFFTGGMGAVAKAMAEGRIQGTESFPATMTLRVAGLDLEVVFDGEIRLA